ncbi:hypothetical protein RCL1_002958 [Eukaryota sp. TZLM3-RCL]
MLESDPQESSLIPGDFSLNMFNFLVTSHSRFRDIVESDSNITASSLFVSPKFMSDCLLKSELVSLIKFIITSFTKVKMAKSGNKADLSSRVYDFLTHPSKYFPSSVVLNSLINSSASCCLVCGSEMSSDDIVFSFCHCCVPTSFSSPVCIPPIVKINLASQLSFSISLILNSLNENNTWNPAPFWGIFDHGVVKESATNHKPSSISNLELSFENLLWLGRYSLAHSLLNKQQLAPNNADTFEQLKQLHPYEDFSMISNKLSEAHEYWQRNPLKPKEVFTALKSRKSSSAPGPSGLSYDHLKIA